MYKTSDNFNSYRANGRHTHRHTASHRGLPSTDSVPVSAQNSQSNFAINDFYLTNIEKKINQSSKSFGKLRKACLQQVIQNSSKTTFHPSKIYSGSTNNLFNDQSTHPNPNAHPMPKGANLRHIKSKSEFVRDIPKSQATPPPSYLPTTKDSSKLGNLTNRYFDKEIAHPSYGNYMSTLTTEQKKVYGESKPMRNLFKDFDLSYFCMEEIAERVKCYKSELGILLSTNIKTMKELFDSFMNIGLSIIKYHKMTNDKIFKQSLKVSFFLVLTN